VTAASEQEEGSRSRRRKPGRGREGESVSEGEARFGHTQASRLPGGELIICCKNCISHFYFFKF